MQGFLITISLFMLSAISVYGDNSLHHKEFKQFIASSAKSLVTPLNAASCDDLLNDVYKNCDPNNVADDCKDEQKLLDCAVKYIRVDCGKDQIKKYCDKYYDQYADSDSCKLTCSANSLLVTSGIVAILFYKMFLEKMILNF